MEIKKGVLLKVSQEDIDLLKNNPTEFWKGVTSIGDEVFVGYSSLSKVVVPDSVTSVGNYAFVGVPTVNILEKNICGDLIYEELIKVIKNKPDSSFKHLNSIYLLAKEHGITICNIRELVALSVNLGILEPKTTVVQTGKDESGKPTITPVNNMVYTFMQGIINKKEIQLNDLHTKLQGMKIDAYNEAFMKFVINKSNWSAIKENIDVLNQVYGWFKTRTTLDLAHANNVLLPTKEEDRYKVLAYEPSENGVYRMHWRTPTIELLLKEFEKAKFTGIENLRHTEIAEELSKYHIYTQKHFDKAKEIDEERISAGTQDILSNPVKQGRVESLDQYRSEMQKLRAQVLEDCAEILHDQIEDTASVFTYEVLSKSEPANFALGCLTNSCATLYGTGAGAMRGMIIHPDMQSLVIRDFDKNIISFGIIYVNRKEGYAVVNDFEVNKKYVHRPEQLKNIYQKAMQGVSAFVKEYNQENPSKPIKKVTCGVTPNWQAINNYIEKNPESEILEAPDFDSFKYAGSGSWAGDWHYGQYEIWNKQNEIRKGDERGL